MSLEAMKHPPAGVCCPPCPPGASLMGAVATCGQPALLGGTAAGAAASSGSSLGSTLSSPLLTLLLAQNYPASVLKPKSSAFPRDVGAGWEAWA